MDFGGGIKGNFEKFVVVDLLFPATFPSPGDLSINFQIFKDDNQVAELTQDIIEIDEWDVKEPAIV